MNNALNEEIQNLTGAVKDFRADYDDRLAANERRLNQLHESGLTGSAKTRGLGILPKSYNALLTANENLNGEYFAQLDRYLRFGPNAIQNSGLSTGSDPAGGFLVGAEQADSILTRVFESSPIRQISGHVAIGTDSYEIPVDHSEISSGWVDEHGARDETSAPTLAMQRIQVFEQYGMPKASQRVLEDARIPIDQHLNARIADKFARTEATAFVSGSGVGRPRGFLSYAEDATTEDDDARNWAVLQYIPSGAAGGFPTVSGLVSDDANCLHNVVKALKPVYRSNATWVMNRNTAGLCRQLRDSMGRWLWTDSLADGQPDRLLGYKVILAEDMPNVASDSASIAFGDFSRGYLVVDRVGLSVLRDPYTSKGYVKFYARKRCGGDVVDFDALKILRFSVS